MDFVDAPMMSQRHPTRGLAHEDFQSGSYKKQPKSSFQSELGAKLKARKKQGLTTDLTSDDTEEDEEVNDYLSQYRLDPSKQRKDRPLSAKHRQLPEATTNFSLNSTLRPGEANKWMKQQKPSKEPHTEIASSMPPLRASPKDSHYSDLSRGSPADRFQSPRDSQSGGSLKSTPRDSLFPSQLHHQDRDGDLMQHRKSAASPKDHSLMPSLTKTPSPIDHSANKAKEELLFGRKTPTKDERRKSPTDVQSQKPWQPPSFRKASPVSVESESSTSLPSPGDHHGRRHTPVQSELGTIEEKKESPKPTPRLRQKSGDEERTTPRFLRKSAEEEKPMPRFRPKSGEAGQTFPRTRTESADLAAKKRSILSDEPRPEPVPRPKPKSDIFGKTDTTSVDLDLEEDAPKPRSRAQIEKQKMEAQSAGLSKTPKGRKTPESFKSQRQQAQSPVDGRKTETEKEPTLLDFMTDTSNVPKPKQRQILQKDEKYDLTTTTPKRAPRLSETVSRRSPEISLQTGYFHDTVIPDDSSVCADLEQEPRPKSTGLGEKLTSKTPTRQRSDKKAIDSAIDTVASSQTPGSIMKPIQPDRNADSSGVHPIHKPKPRHKLPGTPGSQDSELSFDNTQNIRQAIYEEWRKQKNKTIRKQLSEEAQLDMEKRKKEEKEKKDKMLEAELSYRAWKEQKKDSLKKQAQEKNKKKKQEEEEEREKKMRLKEADKNFKMWKEKKDEVSVENKRKEKRKENIEKREKEENKQQRRQQSFTAFRGWKNRKDQIIQRNVMTAKEIQKQKKLEERQEAQKREKSAVKFYDDWMTKKEEQEKKNKLMKRHSVDDIDFRPAWRPSSHTVPFGR